jgi:hypothetical protein
MRLALAALEEEALAADEVVAVGLVVPESDGRVSYQIRTTVWTSLNVLDTDDLPLPLRPPVPGIQQFAVAGPPADVANDRLRPRRVERENVARAAARRSRTLLDRVSPNRSRPH